MPCNCDDYSQPRAMDPSEAWRSLSRHHLVLEAETEALRKYATALEKQLKNVKAMFPGIALVIPDRPEETPSWSGQTYRDKDGKFPNDIHEHVDWLSVKDFLK